MNGIMNQLTENYGTKDFLANGDILEINNPKENEDIIMFGKANGKSFEIVKNQGGKFEIRRAIYANEGKTEISVYIVYGTNIFEIFTVSTKEHFIANPYHILMVKFLECRRYFYWR